jgi:hypothetical protein
MSSANFQPGLCSIVKFPGGNGKECGQSQPGTRVRCVADQARYYAIEWWPRRRRVPPTAFVCDACCTHDLNIAVNWKAGAVNCKASVWTPRPACMVVMIWFDGAEISGKPPLCLREHLEVRSQLWLFSSPGEGKYIRVFPQ